tara:strand:+ start:4456 stop:4662 length:207 start_codon:yes stop_codon:yes gene_type:complete
MFTAMWITPSGVPDLLIKMVNVGSLLLLWDSQFVLQLLKTPHEKLLATVNIKKGQNFCFWITMPGKPA